MNRTVRLELPNAAARSPVAGHVVLALAIACGAGPLAGERLRRSVQAAAAEAGGALVIAAVAEWGMLDLAFTATPDDGWADRATALLAHHGAVRTSDGVELRVQRASLFRVADV